MIVNLPPAIILIGGALAVPLLKGRFKRWFMMALPVIALVIVHQVPEGEHWKLGFMGWDLVLGKVDSLNRVFGYIFSLISIIAVLFALKVEDDIQHVAALIYAGSALGVTFAGDFFSLYVFWEFMAVASTFLVLARRTKTARAAAFRYVLVHLAGGLVLLAGIIIRYAEKGTLAVEYIGLDNMSSWLIFLGIAVNAAIPPLHPWLKDAYPEGTPTGSVFLSAFTTKSAVYLMARTFPGTELLIWLGAIMTFVPIFYAVLENDIRGVLSYSLINQVGFMMCGIGIGTQLAINGTVSHAFCHILYKALLFMAAGSVLHMTGKIRCTDLGGLYKYMPFTCVCCMIGAASISAFPLFSGFVSKSMIVSAAGHGKLIAIWLMLQFASAGVFHHAGIKVPYFIFFGHDSGLKAKEPPWNMQLAMGIAAFLCIFLGVYPKPLYNILPYPVDYIPYTGAHVMAQLQLLMFGALAFALLMLSGIYPAEIRAINLDTDWFYRKGGKWFYGVSDWGLNGLNTWCHRIFVVGLPSMFKGFARQGHVLLSIWLLAPIYRLSGVSGQFLALRKKTIKNEIEKGTVPIGVSAAAAALVILIIFMLTL